MRILLIGYGRMGRLVGELAGQYGCEVAGVVDPQSPAHSGPTDDPRWLDVEVAIDFSTAEAVVGNVPELARRGIDIVLGTTGWQQHGPALHAAIEQAGTGMVAAPNFSPGVVLFESLVARAARLFATRDDFGAFLHEAHGGAVGQGQTRLVHHAGRPRGGRTRSARAPVRLASRCRIQIGVRT
jgi:4-hydroxy-tetrahydrodipicolinate reductase